MSTTAVIITPILVAHILLLVVASTAPHPQDGVHVHNQRTTPLTHAAVTAAAAIPCAVCSS